jgi:hypothetical protein
MRSVFIVFFYPLFELIFSMLRAKEPFFRIKFRIEGSPYSFDFSVGLRMIGFCVDVFDSEGLAGCFKKM